jgi:hypothetical protein
MLRSWRSSVLLTLLFLIALILVLPQVDLPDYVSSDVAAKIAAPHLAHASANAGLHHAVPVGPHAIAAVTAFAIPNLNPPSRRPLLVVSPELRC